MVLLSRVKLKAANVFSVVRQFHLLLCVHGIDQNAVVYVGYFLRPLIITLICIHMVNLDIVSANQYHLTS